ncbi:MAG: hydrogenase nickel incorporation protein HypB [Candidatus Thorarchaeota archaeon]
MSEIVKVAVGKNVREKNNELAAALRKDLSAAGITVIDIVGSIGAGKTSLLEEMARRVNPKSAMLVINGDLTTSIDADRIKAHGVETIQINTGKGCHLNALQIDKVLKDRDISKLKVIFVENVGNLICPADWDVGAHWRIVMTSISEGPYVVQKHPLMFKLARFSIMNKADLIGLMEIDADKLKADAIALNPGLKVFFTSAKTGEGLGSIFQEIATAIGISSLFGTQPQ